MISISAKKFAWALVGLAFLSKVSFSFTRMVPSSQGFWVFQYGIHPYLNVALNFILGGFLLFHLRTEIRPIWYSFPRAYRIFSLLMFGLLVLQHILQMLNGSEVSGALLVATLFSTLFLVFLFGFYLPASLGVESLLRGIGILSQLLCLISILLYIGGLGDPFKGARFVGIFKHIPFMVTVSTLGVVCAPFLFFYRFDFKWRAFVLAGFVGSSVCLIFTGTRSALFSSLLAIGLVFLYRQLHSDRAKVVKVLALYLLTISTLLFGSFAYQFGMDLATGKASLGSRAPQDGLGDRTEEIYRGLEMLEESPHIGLGMLSKFGATDGEDVVDSYNSFQDPHNLFISSAVVAGWPFALMVGIGFLLMAYGAVRLVVSGMEPNLTVGAYLISQISILAIYHMHLSLGGLADRMYWLFWGMLALSFRIKKT